MSDSNKYLRPFGDDMEIKEDGKTLIWTEYTGAGGAGGNTELSGIISRPLQLN